MVAYALGIRAVSARHPSSALLIVLRKEVRVQTRLDCRGLSCPMPIVKISRAMKPLSAGDELVIEADDPAFKNDLEAWAHKMGAQIVTFEGGRTQKAVIRKG